MATKSDILESGPYDSFPRIVRASRLLEASDKLVYSALFGRLGDNPWSFPGQKTIAADTGLSERSVRYAIQRLAEIGLISYSLGDENNQKKYKSYHYVFAIPADVLTIENDPQNAVILRHIKKVQRGVDTASVAGVDTASVAGVDMTDPNQQGGNGCRCDTASVAGGVCHTTASVAGVLRQALPVTTATVAAETNQETNHLNQITQGNKSVEPNHSPQPPSAAERAEPTTPNLDQGNREEEPNNQIRTHHSRRRRQGRERAEPTPNSDQGDPESHQALLKVWTQQNRPLPNPEKLVVCWKLLAIQERETDQTLNPGAIQPDDDLQFVDLFRRTGAGRYRWQELQSRDLSQTIKPLKQMKRALDKQGSAAQIEQIYQAYPRHVGKGAALKAIKAAVKRMEERDSNEDAVGFLLERTKLFAASAAGQRGQYTAYPSTWFNRESYLDDEQEWGVTENRSGSIKRDLTQEEDTTPGQTMQDFLGELE